MEENFYASILSVLKQDERNRFFSDDGDLLRNAVCEATMQMDNELITLLLKNKATKEKFFKDVDNILVFDKIAFGWAINNKAFLPDSYTRFKNKIGLVDSNEQFIAAKNEVVLSFPYKDCILEGGQTKEDQKRGEVFYNEILAPDEVDRLLYPKVFTNVKKYTKDGESKIINFDDKDNLLIKGNNLLTISSILKRFEGKIKCCYIDPPYNTTDDSFNYNDTFNHSSWLTFIKDRLKIAQRLLAKNGVIFIHISDIEMHYLKVLADEIFGRENFVATIPRKTRNGKSDVPYKMSQDYDWVLSYTNAKSSQEEVFHRTTERKYYKSDDYPHDEWRLTDLTTQRTIKERPNSNFTLVSPKDGRSYPVSPSRCWSITKDSKDEYIQRGKIVFPGDYDFLKTSTPYMRVFKSEEIELKGEDFDQTYVSTDCLNKAMDVLLKDVVNKKGTDEITGLFGTKIFSYPKNELLIQTLIEAVTKEGDIVLDFFGGSGTTAAAAHKLKRQFITVEQMDYIENVTKQRLLRVLEGEQGGISKLVNWQGGGSFTYCELKENNQLFIDRILATDEDVELSKLFKQILSTGFISYKVKVKAINENEYEFKNLSVDDKKKFLLEILDKNMLYVNYCDIDDTEYAVSEDDKVFTKSFYGDI